MFGGFRQLEAQGADGLRSQQQKGAQPGLRRGMAGKEECSWACRCAVRNWGVLLLLGTVLWSEMTGSEALRPGSSPSANTVTGSQTGNLIPGWPFLYGYNLGNLKLIPFQEAPYSYSRPQLQALLHEAFADMRAQGATARFLTFLPIF